MMSGHIPMRPVLRDVDVTDEDVCVVLTEWMETDGSIGCMINVGEERKTVWLCQPETWTRAVREAARRKANAR